MVHDSQGSAESLVRRGGITNYHVIAYSFSNTSAKNYQSRLMCVEVIVCNVSVIFWRHSVECYNLCINSKSRHKGSSIALSVSQLVDQRVSGFDPGYDQCFKFSTVIDTVV